MLSIFVFLADRQSLLTVSNLIHPSYGSGHRIPRLSLPRSSRPPSVPREPAVGRQSWYTSEAVPRLTRAGTVRLRFARSPLSQPRLRGGPAMLDHSPARPGGPPCLRRQKVDR